MDGSNYNQRRCYWIASSGCSAYSPLEGSGGKNRNALKSPSATDNYAQSHEDCTILDEGTTKPSADGKKRKACDDWSQFAQLKNLRTEEEKKPVAATCCETSGREVRVSSTSWNSPKEDCVHVRAKRGQATNSHSLAERVRREKIRERMKFLQDLVPGCSKITGKAIMLDEIINYVLSLQRQVEFLSMKLATFCPEAVVEPPNRFYQEMQVAVQLCKLGDPKKELLSKRSSARSLAGYPDLKPS